MEMQMYLFKMAQTLTRAFGMMGDKDTWADK